MEPFDDFIINCKVQIHTFEAVAKRHLAPNLPLFCWIQFAERPKGYVNLYKWNQQKNHQILRFKASLQLPHWYQLTAECVMSRHQQVSHSVNAYAFRCLKTADKSMNV